MYDPKDDNLADLKKAITQFINMEIAFGGDKKSTELALKNIIKECMKEW